MLFKRVSGALMYMFYEQNAINSPPVQEGNF
jgi:hypothetical protein